MADARIGRGVAPFRTHPPSRASARSRLRDIVAENPMLSAANQFSAACIMNTRWQLLAPDLFLRTTGMLHIEWKHVLRSRQRRDHGARGPCPILERPTDTQRTRNGLHRTTDGRIPLCR